MCCPIPLLIADLIFGKEVTLIVCRHNFYQKFWLQGIFFVSRSFEKVNWIKSLHTKQFPAEFSRRIHPLHLYLLGCFSLLPKDSKMNCFWLIIAGSLPLHNSAGGWGSLFQKNRGVNFPSKKERLLWESNLWLLLIFLFVNPRNIAI